MRTAPYRSFNAAKFAAANYPQTRRAPFLSRFYGGSFPALGFSRPDLDHARVLHVLEATREQAVPVLFHERLEVHRHLRRKETREARGAKRASVIVVPWLLSDLVAATVSVPFEHRFLPRQVTHVQVAVHVARERHHPVGHPVGGFRNGLGA